MNEFGTMKCKVCGKRVRSIGDVCVDCYIDSDLPTRVDDKYWVHMDSCIWTFSEKGRYDISLRSAITSMNSRISIDKSMIVLKLDGKEVSVPVTVEKLDELAMKSGLLIGKWLLDRSRSEVDVVWKTIAKSTFRGELGLSAKVSTASSSSTRHVICVYTHNYLDSDDVMKVREKLRELGSTEKLCYKPDIYTYLGIYWGTTRLSPCRYRK